MTISVDEKMINRDGELEFASDRKVHYQLLGRDPTNHPRKVVVLAHGQPGVANPYLDPKWLDDNGFLVVAVNRHGYFETTPIPNRDTTHVSDDVINVLDDLRIKQKVVSIGISGGGIYAAALAADYPERVEELILQGSAVPLELFDIANAGSTNRRQMRSNREEFAKEIAGIADAVRTNRYALLEQLEKDDRLRDPMHPDRRLWNSQPMREILAAATYNALTGKHGTDGWLADWNVLQNWHQLGFDYSTITVPTTIVSGGRDIFCPPETQRRLAELIPNARLVELPHAGHTDMTLALPSVLALLANDERRWDWRNSLTSTETMAHRFIFPESRIPKGVSPIGKPAGPLASTRTRIRRGAGSLGLPEADDILVDRALDSLAFPAGYRVVANWPYGQETRHLNESPSADPMPHTMEYLLEGPSRDFYTLRVEPSSMSRSTSDDLWRNRWRQDGLPIHTPIDVRVLNVSDADGTGGTNMRCSLFPFQRHHKYLAGAIDRTMFGYNSAHEAARFIQPFHNEHPPSSSRPWWRTTRLTSGVWGHIANSVPIESAGAIAQTLSDADQTNPVMLHGNFTLESILGVPNRAHYAVGQLLLTNPVGGYSGNPAFDLGVFGADFVPAQNAVPRAIQWARDAADVYKDLDPGLVTLVMATTWMEGLANAELSSTPFSRTLSDAQGLADYSLQNVDRRALTRQHFGRDLTPTVA